MKSPLAIPAFVLLFLAVGPFLLSLYTARKLDKGRMVRGELPGATFFVGVVTEQRRVDNGRSDNGKKLPDQCELKIRVEGMDPVREWADEGVCKDLHVGSRVELARVPGDQALYLRNGTWASLGNAGFDASLLVGERVIMAVLLVAGASLIGFALLRKRA